MTADAIMPLRIQWKRAKRADIATAKRLRWFSKCDAYEIQELSARVGGQSKLYISLTGELVNGFRFSTILGRHRTRFAAVNACERDFKQKGR